MEVMVQSMGILTIPSLSSNSSSLCTGRFQFSNSTANLKFAPIPTALKCRNEGRRTKFRYPKAAADVGETKDEGETKEVKPKIDDFEARIAKYQRKRPGTGKKAEMRKLRKAGMDPSKVKSRKETILLPPVPLKDPMSGGLKVELGFNSYSERLNARFAALGLAALLLVELASGQSLIKYHAPGTLILQTYFILAVSALVVKYEKENISIWPKSKP
ncbi:hypothetical protein SUGI_0045780 [Cryptomeria japonica]|uniref:uncharacterized protein LOC131043590 n=1 Tax=Cryptomeria japonica TaxID=3369 RepID=UPI002408D587|nr:uncharacterized protein LOC131043590 [Cryptomeria japonica]GLJ06707.1 hypothetical protein SUGI_0045780 [Cryptomeria japonica]